MSSLEMLLGAGAQPSSADIADVLHRLDQLDPPRRAAIVDVAFPAEIPVRYPGLWAVLTDFEATLVDCGAQGVDEQQTATANQCFYLCLAAAAKPPAEPHAQIALSFRRHIEAAVLAKYPNWVDPAGPEAGAFADFLAQGLPAIPELRRHAVAIYQSHDGVCVVYRSPTWHDPTAPVIGLLHYEAHYQLLRWGRPAGGPTLSVLQASHNEHLLGSPRVPQLEIQCDE